MAHFGFLGDMRLSDLECGSGSQCVNRFNLPMVKFDACSANQSMFRYVIL